MTGVGIVGYGNMGQAIGERIKNKYTVYVFDKNKKVSSENINAVTNFTDLVSQVEAVILAIKPQDFDSMLVELKPLVKGKLMISIAAGITTDYLRNQLGEDARIIRVMPNLCAQVGQGVSVLFKDKNATEKDLDLAWHLLSCVGLALPIVEEKMINAATAVSGGGPAFFCHYIKDKPEAADKRDEFIQILAKAAVDVNFDLQFARTLAEKTVDGTLAMLVEKNLSCQELIKMVASKGGTTQAGLDVLNSGGSIKSAVEAALERANQLGKRS